MWWVWLQKHKNVFWATAALALTFLTGWQAGRVTSPYYAAHPIIFQGPSPGPAALESLIPSVTPAGTVTPLPQPTSVPEVASQGKYVASVNSTLYHDATCPSASRIKPTNQVWFASREEAEAAGYSPSACTKEKLGLP